MYRQCNNKRDRPIIELNHITNFLYINMYLTFVFWIFEKSHFIVVKVLNFSYLSNFSIKHRLVSKLFPIFSDWKFWCSQKFDNYINNQYVRDMLRPTLRWSTRFKIVENCVVFIVAKDYSNVTISKRVKS